MEGKGKGGGKYTGGEIRLKFEPSLRNLSDANGRSHDYTMLLSQHHEHCT